MNHPNIDELLPWYLNGTLDDTEHALVEAELASRSESAESLAGLEAIRLGVLDLHERGALPSAHAMQRIFERIDRPATLSAARVARVAEWLKTSRGRIALRFAAALVIAFSGTMFVSRMPSVHTGRYFPSDVDHVVVKKSVALPDVGRNYQASSQSGVPALRPKTPYLSGAAASVASASGVPAAKVAHAAQAMIARSGSVTLLVDDVEGTLRSFQAYVRSSDGVVLNLDDQIPSDPGASRTAKIDVRFAAERFDSAMEAMARFGALQARTVSAEDVGRQIVDGDARLRNLRRTEADLLRIMDRSGKVSEILEVQNQISSVRESIEQLDSEQKDLRERVAYATIAVTLVQQAKAAPAQPSMSAQIADAWEAALRSVRAFTLGVIAVAFAWIAFLPYLALAAVGAALIWRRVRRR